jgi:hypothetical protein
MGLLKARASNSLPPHAKSVVSPHLPLLSSWMGVTGCPFEATIITISDEANEHATVSIKTRNHLFSPATRQDHSRVQSVPEHDTFAPLQVCEVWPRSAGTISATPRVYPKRTSRLTAASCCFADRDVVQYKLLTHGEIPILPESIHQRQVISLASPSEQLSCFHIDLSYNRSVQRTTRP